MRWVPLAILIYVLVVIQTSLLGIVTLRWAAVGPVRPDLMAILAVYLALYARSGADAMLAAWIMGMAIDLTTGAGPKVSTAAGPMALGSALAAGCVFRLREVVFRDSHVAQGVMAGLFCVLSHGFWVTAQWLVMPMKVSASGYALMLVQAALLAVYTGLVTPLGAMALRRCERWILSAPSGRSRRRRR